MIGGETRLCCVLGDPVAHSRSPRMHNAAYEALGLDRRYVAFRVRASLLPAALRGLVALGFDGANVTIPHKQAAARLCSRLVPEAQAAGAVNTLVPGPDGLVGHLTDGSGLVAALREVAPGAEQGEVLLLGAGGTARAAAAALLASGARLRIVARREEAARALAAGLAAAGRVEALAAVPAGALGTVVNCTPVGGIAAGESLPLEREALARAAVLADYAYRPDGSGTPAVAAARAAGLAVVDGLELLVRQGALAFRLMTGLDAPIDVMRAAARG